MLPIYLCVGASTGGLVDLPGATSLKRTVSPSEAVSCPWLPGQRGHLLTVCRYPQLLWVPEHSSPVMSSGHCLRLVLPDIRLRNVLLPSLKWSLSLCGRVGGVYDVDVLFVTSFAAKQPRLLRVLASHFTLMFRVTSTLYI